MVGNNEGGLSWVQEFALVELFSNPRLIIKCPITGIACNRLIVERQKLPWWPGTVVGKLYCNSKVTGFAALVCGLEPMKVKVMTNRPDYKCPGDFNGDNRRDFRFSFAESV